ncbi:HAD family phosphatase [Kovacikia minuta CCNUW1]|uniref:HAD family hydrolase n=1 Tax=Kovacikia minuta TaxID=2931930 RepID=UPI001CCD57CD|nr:HAD family phosphatase [Kovacikia minuta]UBF28427.1 HAD family phosphatase [Kovacikia minuta CCNUW1]
MQTTLTLPELAPETMTAIRLAALLFDLDGTMANTDPVHYLAWAESLREFGLEIDDAFYKNRVSGRLNPAIVRDLLPQLSPEASQRFIARKEARFRQLAPQLAPLPGLSKLINWGEIRGLRQAVVTNAPTENVHHTLRALHLETHFDQVVIAESLGVGKPDPAPYRHALKRFGLVPAQAVAFEDSPSGVRSAVGAGIPTVGIASTQDPQVLYAVGAMLVVPDFAAPELWTWLGKRVSDRDHGNS